MLKRDNTGKILPLGRTIRRLREDLMPGTALPAWLQVGASAGTATYNDISQTSDVGNVSIASATGAGSVARLETVTTIGEILKYDEIIWTIEGLKFDNSLNTQVLIALSNTGGTIGVGFYHDGANATGVLRGYKTGPVVTDVPTHAQLLGSDTEPRIRRNVSLRLQPKVGDLYLLEDDQVLAYAAMTGKFAGGPIRPKVQITNVDAAAHSFAFSAVELQLIHN